MTVVAGVKQEWDNCWTSLESICLNAAELGHVLKYGTKNRKRRAFTDLLKTLEACGLSKHRLVNTAVLKSFVSLYIFKPFLTSIIAVYVYIVLLCILKCLTMFSDALFCFSTSAAWGPIRPSDELILATIL